MLKQKQNILAYKLGRLKGDDKMKIRYRERCEIVAMLYKYDFNNKVVEIWIDDFKKCCSNFKVKETDVLSYLIWEGQLLEK